MSDSDDMSQGIFEAEAWLRIHAVGWRLRRAESTLVPGIAYGMPTALRYVVELRHDPDDDVYLTGEGMTLLAATQNAVGAIRDGRPHD